MVGEIVARERFCSGGTPRGAKLTGEPRGFLPGTRGNFFFTKQPPCWPVGVSNWDAGVAPGRDFLGFGAPAGIETGGERTLKGGGGGKSPLPFSPTCWVGTGSGLCGTNVISPREGAVYNPFWDAKGQGSGPGPPPGGGPGEHPGGNSPGKTHQGGDLGEQMRGGGGDSSPPIFCEKGFSKGDLNTARDYIPTIFARKRGGPIKGGHKSGAPTPI